MTEEKKETDREIFVGPLRIFTKVRGGITQVRGQEGSITPGDISIACYLKKLPKD